jgi:hypothetical protein
MTQIKYIPGHYLAFVLSEQSRSELIKLVPPSFGRVICHHVTLAFKLDENLFEGIMEVIGEHPKVVVTGLHQCDNIECFAVDINNAHRLLLNSQRYHITHSLNDPAKPFDSNRVIAGTEAVKQMNVLLQGTVEMVRK